MFTLSVLQQDPAPQLSVNYVSYISLVKHFIQFFYSLICLTSYVVYKHHFITYLLCPSLLQLLSHKVMPVMKHTLAFIVINSHKK